MAGDFAHIRSLGFNTIVADAIDDQRRRLLLDVAEVHSLRVILPHIRTTAYIQGNRSDPAVLRGAATIARENIESVGAHPALFMHFLDDAPPLDVVGRLTEMVRWYERYDLGHPVFVPLTRDVAALVRRVRLPVVVWDNFPLAENAALGEFRNRRYATPATHAEALAEIYAQTPGCEHWAMIQALAMPGRVRMPTPAELSALHLTSLAAGFVDGVVFFRYHADERPDTGLATANHAMPPERTAAVRRIIERAKTWGPMLKQSRPSPLVLRTENARLRPKLFVGAKRRFLLVFNPDLATFGYDTVYVPTIVHGRPVARAVNVDQPKRFLATGSTAEIAIELRLRPGDGCLLELFGP
jgi:hypothetical protein